VVQFAPRTIGSIAVLILIAEDQPDIADLMARLVVRAGHQASVAKDGFEAVRLAEENAFDMILLDINMPGMDGYETAKRIRQQTCRQIPIFAITATIVDRSLANRCGFDGVFAKPFDRGTLASLIERFS
jgi:CheY-like chemotaxis protein